MKIGGKIVTGVIVTTLILGGGVVVYKLISDGTINFDKKYDDKQEDKDRETWTDEQKKEHDEAKEKLETKVPDKNPDEIEILPTDTPEEVEQKEEEKYYWQVNNKLLEIVNNSFSDIEDEEAAVGYEALSVKNIYFNGGKLYVVCDTVLRNETRYESYDSLYEITVGQQFDGYENLFKSLEGKENAQVVKIVDFKQKDGKKFQDFYHIVTTNETSIVCDLIEQEGATATLVGGNLSIMKEDIPPIGANLFVKVVSGEKEEYHLVNVFLTGIGLGSTEEDYQAAINDPTRIAVNNKYVMTEAVDWMSLNLQYNENYKSQQSEQNQEAEAQAAVSNKFTNADGTKDYAGYVEDKGATEVKTTQQNPQVVEMNLGF